MSRIIRRRITDHAEQAPAPVATEPKLPPDLAGIAVTLDQVHDTAAKWAIRGVAEVDDFILLVAVEFGGKTWLALYLALCTILGGPWLGFEVSPRRGRVLYVSAEGSRRKLRRRVQKLCAGLDLNSQDLDAVLRRIVVIDRPLSFVPSEEHERIRAETRAIYQRAVATTYDSQQQERIRNNRSELMDTQLDAKAPGSGIVESIRSAPPGTWALIIVDTVAQCCPGDENSAKDMRLFTRALRELAEKHQCPVLALHHTSKGRDFSQGGGRTSRGSSELTAGARVTITVDSYNVAHFKSNEHAAPNPVRYAVVDSGPEAVRIDAESIVPGPSPARSTNTGVSAKEVEAALSASATAKSLSSIRQVIATHRGSKPGGKASEQGTKTALQQCVASGTVKHLQREGKDLWLLVQRDEP